MSHHLLRNVTNDIYNLIEKIYKKSILFQFVFNNDRIRLAHVMSFCCENLLVCCVFDSSFFGAPKYFQPAKFVCNSPLKRKCNFAFVFSVITLYSEFNSVFAITVM